MSFQSDAPDFLSGVPSSSNSVPPPPSDLRASDADSLFIPPPMIEEDDNEGLPPPPPEDESASSSAATGHFRVSSFHHQSSHSRGSFTNLNSNSSDNFFSPKSFSSIDDITEDDDDNKGSSNPISDTPIMEIPKEKSFATCLTHNFDIVSRQVEMGVYAAKRIGSMLKKITTLQDEFAKGVLKVLAHEKTKMDRLSGDGMKKYGKVWQKVQDIIGLLAKTYEDDAKKVQNEVIQPLLDFYEANEEKRKVIMGDERKASLEMTKAREEVNKNLQKCTALLKDAKKAQAEEAMKDKGDKNKSMSMKGMFKTFQKALAKSATQIQTDAAKAAQVYNLSINQANKRQEHYLKKDLPMVFSSMQVLEKERLEQAKQKLTKYALIEEKFAEERKKITEQLQKTITELDTDDDINSFIEDYVLEHGLPTKTFGYAYQLPCSPKDIEQGRLEGNPKSVFRSTLEHIMELQKDTHPSLDVPRILITCIENVKNSNGFQSEGIFRISISKTELESLHKQIDDGNYDLKISSPHAPAALLKEWLRLLAEPLIPIDLYNEAVLMIKDREYSPSEILRFFDKLSPLSRRVLEHLSAMAKEISNEINSPITKMTMENLAIVFAPSFLRSPSDDPLELLQNSKYEIKFTTALFKTIAPQTAIRY